MEHNATLYTHATIITVDNSRTIWLDGAILVKGSRIQAIGKTTELNKHPTLPPQYKTMDCRGKIVIPGLINTHAHLGQSLLRGLAEDLQLHSWLCDAIWPLESCYEGDDGYIAARVTIAEMLKSGTTCFLEALLTPTSGIENAARALQEMGIRGCLVSIVAQPWSCPSKVSKGQAYKSRRIDQDRRNHRSTRSAHLKYVNRLGSCCPR